jgi:hypothetical protein
MQDEPPDKKFRDLAKRIYVYVTQENKRRNLIGEGFEDVVTAVVGRLPLSIRIGTRNRSLLHDLPGFHAPPPHEKAKKVDLALLWKNKRVLICAKWSIRADREEHFSSDFEHYTRLEAARQDFEYVLVTIGFDAARLKAVCKRRRQNTLLSIHGVDLNPKLNP